MSTPASSKKSYGRPKSAEPGSPLLRRALSPDRLHPRSAENKTSISPLANSVVRVTPRVTIAQTSHPESSDDNSDASKDNDKNDIKKSVEKSSEYSKISHTIPMSINIPMGGVGLSNSCGGTQLPRIAEEKDSPTGCKSDDYCKDISESTSISDKVTSGLDKNDDSKISSNSESSASSDSVRTVIPCVSEGGKSSLSSMSSLSSSTSSISTTSSTSISVSMSTASSAANQCLKNPTSTAVASASATACNEFDAATPKIIECKMFNKSKMETSPETRKILKRYKVDSTDSSTSGSSKTETSAAEDKKNK